MKTIIVISFGFLLYFLPTAGVMGEMKKYNASYFSTTPLNVPENVEIRNNYSDILFGSNKDILDAPENVYNQSYFDHRVRFQTRKNDESIYMLFTNEEDFKFPLYSAGSYIIKKDRDSGSFVQVKIFVRSDPESFIRVFPWGNRSRMDVYIHGYPAYKDVNLSHPFETVLIEPFSRLVEISGSSIDWSLLAPGKYTEGSKRIYSMVQAIRNELPRLEDGEDGAIDAEGVYRYIETLAEQDGKGLNCSGFAKWIVDGIYYDRNSRFLDIEELKKKPEGLRGNRWSTRYEDERDPYFGLDWTRNLAASVAGAAGGEDNRKPGSLEKWDVREIPFLTYIEDVGFQVDNLSFILYYLALNEPGYFYLASLNSPFGEEPALRQHFHVALLFPYFDEEGRFHKVIMERTVESSAKNFIARYGRDYIHIVRVKAPANYTPPGIN